MKDTIVEDVRGTHISFIGVFLFLLTGFQLLQWVLAFFVATILALM
ncbi:MAG: hypothetical protein ACE5KV_05830 [Thermoplasmata archaeon]